MNRLIRTVLGIAALTHALSLHAQEAAVAATPLDKLLETPISTAAGYGQRLGDTAASVTVITAEEIRRYGWETLADALNAVRGLYVSYDRNYAYLGIRGFGRPTDYNNRLLVMIDGQTTNEHVFGSSSVGTDLGLDLSDVERIEFVRGPGSVLYGSGAMLGVVNIITHRANAPETLRAEASAGSGQRLGGSVAFGKHFGGTAVALSINRRSIEGSDLFYREYAEDGRSGVAHDLDYDDILGVLGTVTRGDLKATGFLAHRRKGIPTGAYGTSFDQPSETVDERLLLDVSWSPRLSARTQIETGAFYSRYRYRGEYAYDEPFFDLANGSFVGVEARGLFDLRPNHRLTVGVRFIDELRMEYGYLRSDQQTASDTDTDTDTISLYAQHEYQPLESLTLVAGLRFDRPAGYRGRITPRLAAVYHPNANGTLKLLYGEAYRSPSAWERDYADTDLGYAANPGLRDESIRTAEVVWEQRVSPEVIALVSAYRISMTGLIDPILIPDSSLTQFVNRSSVAGHGVEAELNYRAANGIWSFLHYSIQKTEEKGEQITNSPRHIATTGVSGKLGSRLDGAIEFLYESSRLTYAESTRGLAIANVTLSTRLGPSLTLLCQVRNAMDSRYSLPAGIEHRQSSIDQDGRNFVVRLMYRR